MKRIPAATTVLSVFLSWSCTGALAGVVGTQCWIDGKLVGGFPPGYVCPGTGGGGGFSPAPSFDYEAERIRQEAERKRLEAERQKQRELEEERKREEEEANKRRRQEFERAKQEALDGMKGITEQELGLKDADAGRFGLKDSGASETTGPGREGAGDTGPRQPLADPSVVDLRDASNAKTKEWKTAATEPAERKMKEEVDAAARRIPELRREVVGLQTLLKQYGASQRGNVSEFEKWDETFRAAAENSRKNAVEYGLSMFLQYNLLGSLEGRVRKDAFGRLDKLINSTDPQMKRWLGEQLKNRNIELDRVKKAVAAGSLGGDLAALLPGLLPGDLKRLPGDPKDTGKALDALLFVNDLLEATKVVPWTGSQYFQQAKMIGETYTDLAAFGYSVVNVRKAEKATDAYNREIRRLSWKLESTVKEAGCLEKCVAAPAARCMDKCTGKTRFGSPPPSP